MTGLDSLERWQRVGFEAQIAKRLCHVTDIAARCQEDVFRIPGPLANHRSILPNNACCFRGGQATIFATIISPIEFAYQFLFAQCRFPFDFSSDVWFRKSAMFRPRIALIFDNTLRPETTGTYCRRALRKLADVKFFIPDHMDRIPRIGFDLYLNIDDGLRYRLPPDLRPCAWWVIDTHMDLPWAIEKGQDFDWLFAAQRDGTEQLNAAGLSAVWLPLACDPGIHRPWIVQNQWDVCFVGRVSSGPRHELLQSITRHYPRSFVGQRYFDEYAQALCASTIGFNRSVKNDVKVFAWGTIFRRPLTKATGAFVNPGHCSHTTAPSIRSNTCEV